MAAPKAPSGADGLEHRLRQLFPRHARQDDFMHVGSIAAFFMLVIGFVLGFFAGFSWLAWNFLLSAIGLLLFLILRESTLSQLPDRGPAETGRPPGPGRVTSLPSEAVTMQSSPPPPAPGPPTPPRPGQ